MGRSWIFFKYSGKLFILYVLKVILVVEWGMDCRESSEFRKIMEGDIEFV